MVPVRLQDLQGWKRRQRIKAYVKKMAYLWRLCRETGAGFRDEQPAVCDCWCHEASPASANTETALPTINELIDAIKLTLDECNVGREDRERWKTEEWKRACVPKEMTCAALYALAMEMWDIA